MSFSPATTLAFAPIKKAAKRVLPLQKNLPGFLAGSEKLGRQALPRRGKKRFGY
jgi:hypothetical protein